MGDELLAQQELYSVLTRDIQGGGGLLSNPSEGLPQPLSTADSPSFNNLSVNGLLNTTRLQVGGGGIIYKIQAGTVSVDPGSIAGGVRGAVSVTIVGLAAGDLVFLSPPSALDAGLLFAGCRVTGGNTLQIDLANITAVPIDDSAQTWTYFWIDLT